MTSELLVSLCREQPFFGRVGQAGPPSRNHTEGSRDERFKKIDGSGSLYAIIKVSGDDLKEYNFDFGNMNHLVEEHNGKLWVYVQKNAKHVTITRSGYTPLRKVDLHALDRAYSIAFPDSMPINVNKKRSKK